MLIKIVRLIYFIFENCGKFIIFEKRNVLFFLLVIFFCFFRRCFSNFFFGFSISEKMSSKFFVNFR